MYRIIGAGLVLSLTSLTLPAHAESLKQQVVGTWTLTSGVERMADGQEFVRWSAGQLLFEPSGHFAFFIFGIDRPPPEGPPNWRYPVGPMIAYYGTYTVDEAAKLVTYHVENASNPIFTGATRPETVTLNGDIMKLEGSPVTTPMGEITPINEWRRVK